MIEVTFLNTITGSSTVLRRRFESYDVYSQWLSTVRGLVEIVSVRSVVTA